jgi:hypothetical protein
VTTCAVYTVHMKMRSVSFLDESQNQGRRFVSDFGSKLLERFSLVWPQNRWQRFSPLWPQNRWLGFHGLGLKTK